MAGIALAILAVLSGCDSPVAEIPEKKLMPLAVSAPSEVKAIAYEGLNIVTWTPVSNIAGYRVYRQDKSATAESLGVKPVELQWVAGSAGYNQNANIALELYYVDTVSFTNQLVHDHNYVYYVESVSGISTAPGRAIGNYDPSDIADGSSLADGYLQNSELKASNTVKAIIPERNGAYDWIAVPNLTVVKNDVAGGDNMIATWDAKPNLTYEVKYTWGIGANTGIDRDKLGDIVTQNAITTIAYSPFNSVGYASFPAAGGTNSITVYASFAGGAFFNKKAAETKDVAYAMGLDVPGNFSAARVQNNSAWVKLSWTAVENATAYKVYRVEAIAGNNNANPPTYGSITGDWTLITGSYDLNVANANNVNVYTLYDTTAALEKGYKYMLVAEGAADVRSLPAIGNVASASSLNARPDAPANFAAAWVNSTDVKITWNAPGGGNVSDLAYKLYRGAATFKNDQTGAIGNLTGYDYATETALTVTIDNYTGAKLAVLDKPPAAPADKVWVYRVVAVQYGYDSESAFAAITLETAPDLSTANFSVTDYALDATNAFITWNVDEDLYDAAFTLTRARILSPAADVDGTGNNGDLVANDIESVGPYAPVKTTTGVIAPADYLEGKAVVIDTGVTTRSRWLYRLVVKKGNLESNPEYAILQAKAFSAAASVTLAGDNTANALAPNSSDPNAYQPANTQRVALGNLSNTYWGDSPAITLYRREASQPETAYVKVPATGSAFTAAEAQAAIGTPAGAVIFTDTEVDYTKQYVYKVVVTNTDGTIRFKNSDNSEGVSSSLDPAKTTVTLAAYSGGQTLPGKAIWLTATGSSGNAAYLQNMKVKVRTKDTTAATPQYTAWRELTVVRDKESGSGTVADPNVYGYIVKITGLTTGNGYDIQYWNDDGTTQEPATTDSSINVTAN
jgi:hypothetical protein